MMNKVELEPKANLILSLIYDTGLIPDDYKAVHLGFGNTNQAPSFKIINPSYDFVNIIYLRELNYIKLCDGRYVTKIALPKNEAILDCGEFQESFIRYISVLIKEFLEEL